MTPELKHAIEAIRDECEKYRNCVGCPFCSSKDYGCWITRALHPDDWEPDEWEKESKK